MERVSARTDHTTEQMFPEQPFATIFLKFEPCWASEAQHGSNFV